MKPVRDVRLLVAVILLLVAVAFLGGTLRLVRSARASDHLPLPPSGGTSGGFVVRPAAVITGVEKHQGSASMEEDASVAAQETPTPPEVSADTGGIIALAIVIVVTIVLGASMGVRALSGKKTKAK